MFMKCYSRSSIRRRRHYLLNIIFLILCFGLFLQLKYNFIHSLSEEIFINNGSCPNILFSETILNCTGEPLKQWCDNEMKLCNSSLIVYNKLFAVTRSVLLQTKFAQGKRLGGENIQDVLHQAERDEYFHFEKGF